MHAEDLLRKFPIISDQINLTELKVILRELEYATRYSAAGAVVEFGCFAGTTSLFVQRMLKVLNSKADYHVYDSFEGLPTKHPYDQSPVGEQFKPGELAVSKKEFLMNFKKANLTPPQIHKGWFNQLKSDDVPKDIWFAFLDGDFYESIRWPLQLIEAKLRPGAVIIIDDYGNPALPGAKRAVDEWVKRRGATIREEASLAIIRA